MTGPELIQYMRREWPDGASAQQIAEATGRPKTSVSSQLARLFKQGHLLRVGTRPSTCGRLKQTLFAVVDQ